MAQKLDIATILARPEPALHLYVCGPKGMINWVLTFYSFVAFPTDWYC